MGDDSGRPAWPISSPRSTTDLGCGWHTVIGAIVRYGPSLIADSGSVTALGLDETLFARKDRFRQHRWSTQVVVVDVASSSMSSQGATALSRVGGSLGALTCSGPGSSGPPLISSRPTRRCFDTMLSDSTTTPTRCSPRRGLMTTGATSPTPRCLSRSADSAVTLHVHTATSSPCTEAVNNLVRRVRSAAFGLRRFHRCREGRCSTPASPNGPSSTISLHRAIRRAKFPAIRPYTRRSGS